MARKQQKLLKIYKNELIFSEFLQFVIVWLQRVRFGEAADLFRFRLRVFHFSI